MTFFQKIWTWLKCYWCVPLIVVLIIFSVFVGKSNWAMDLLRGVRQSHSDQVAALEALAKKEREEKERLLQQYEVVVAALQAKYAVDSRVMKEEEKKKVKDLVEQYKNDPVGLTSQLANTFGFKVI